MAYAQTQFETFHREILFGYSSSQVLRERRDTLLTDLKNNISDDAPSYEIFTQGSYALHTGIKPLNGNPDMDIGIIFDCSPTDYPDPLTLKKYVRDALERHNRTVNIRNPCVTVTYFKDGQAIHHIDMAVYCTNWSEQTQLAVGRVSTPQEDREWKASEARELITKINDQFSGSDKDQFKRCVRALKRWRDIKIGHRNAPSIAITVAAYNWFVANYDPVDGKPRDSVALKNFLSNFLCQWTGSRFHVYQPVASFTDLFSRMTDVQMSDLKDKLMGLRDSLNEALDQPDTHEACKILQKQFGYDFPVPEKSDTTKQTSVSVSASGRSA